MKKVYVGMTVDVLHHGHINILEHARQYGEVTVGLLTDAAIAEYKRLPYLNYEQRKKIIQNIAGVHQVIPQDEWDYSPNIKRFRPDFMIHGTDWLEGPFLKYRELALNALSECGGKLVEVPYTEGVSSSSMLDDLRAMGITSEARRSSLKRLLNAKPLLRFLEAHSPLSSLLVENSKVNVGGKLREFDGFWSSSLTDSTHMGKPDIEALDISTRLMNVNNIFEVTTKPLIMDADTGGKPEHFEINVRSMERLGISAVIIEDKTGLKKNSLFGNDVEQTQEDPKSFAEKIRAGREARIGSDFMVIARIESLILEKGMSDAINRASVYVEAGVDGIMIHSRRKEPDEIFEFAKLFRSAYPSIPLVCVPTSYNQVYDHILREHGFNIVIYANHLLRASYPAMREVANSILLHGRSAEVDDQLISINEILELIPGTK